jgi:SAM-dependent methyltransferase
MRRPYPLFQTHLDLAHTYWKRLVEPHDIVIDATCGNGHDTLTLAELTPNGQVYALDVQEAAIQVTKQRLESHLDRVTILKQSHAEFPNVLKHSSVKLIVYNLGYLPGGDKQQTTITDSTIRSLQHAKELLMPGGVISVTCYPGHPEGEAEEKELLKEISTWNPHEWSCCQHRWLNRKASPSLVLLQKAL